MEILTINKYCRQRCLSSNVMRKLYAYMFCFSLSSTLVSELNCILGPTSEQRVSACSSIGVTSSSLVFLLSFVSLRSSLPYHLACGFCCWRSIEFRLHSRGAMALSRFWWCWSYGAVGVGLATGGVAFRVIQAVLKSLGEVAARGGGTVVFSSGLACGLFVLRVWFGWRGVGSQVEIFLSVLVDLIHFFHAMDTSKSLFTSRRSLA